MKLKLTALLLLATLFSFGQIVKNQEWEFTNNVTIDGTLKLTDAPTNGYVLTTDGSGNASWQAGSGIVKTATVTLSSAQVLQLHTTPIQLIAAQGAGTVIVPIEISVWIDYNTTAYATDVALRLYFNNNAVTWQNLGATLDKTADFYRQLSIQGNASITGANTLENVNFAVSTGISNPTAGDSPVKITVIYTVINL